jgi:hypothetical protein
MRDTRGRSAAELFDLTMGPVLLVVGALGFIASSAFSTGNPDGSDLIVFEVNGWHNLVHIASGALLLAGVGNRRRARTVTLLFGVTYGLVTIIGWADGHDVLGLFPVDTADNLLHTFLSLAALVFAAMSGPDIDERLATTAPWIGDDEAVAADRGQRFGRGVRERERRG